MSKPIILQREFAGAYQDRARYQLPPNKVWQVTDMIQNLEGAGLTRRGGWTRGYDAMSAVSTSYAAAVGYYSSTVVMGFDEDGRLYTWNPSGGAVTNVGAALLVAHPPTLYRGFAIIPDGGAGGVASPLKYDGATISALGGAPPPGSVSAVFKDHLVLAKSSTQPRRVWFSNSGSAELWDTAADGQWLDCSSIVNGLATIRNMMLVFEEGYTERIRGDIIPGVVGSDMVREPLFQVGCSDPASIAVTDDYVIFANGAGIYLTDGIGLVDVTKQAGMSQFWQSKMTGYDGTFTISGAMRNDWYVFSVMSAAVPIVAGMIYVPTRSWVTLSNVNASMIAASPRGSSLIGSEWLWMSERGSKNIARLDSIFDPGATTADGDTTVLTCSVETPFYMGDGWGKKRWKNLYVSGRASATTTVTVSVTDSPVDTVYASAGTISLSGDVRKRLPIGTAKTGLGVKLAFGSGAAGVDLHSVEADAWALEPGRL